ncbi:hypothetical protein C9374_001490 [Naegleria lovaniensis]|uniref:ABC transporter domain-containing protein n=1 Tax=Naegleria lovaniensis TaxID=51637 RepID=A0AA88KM12_NAELO|nr:uncharacterized protein C9374_001490 [Naegleria lovaniensis]KAG2387158.1 hypothetical protein C9374_001490 [Naegleria lovaniensis]
MSTSSSMPTVNIEMKHIENPSNQENHTTVTLVQQQHQQQQQRTVPSVLLEWHELTYVVKVRPALPASKLTTPRERFAFALKNVFRKEQKVILHAMSGYVKPGSVLAIMGPSGAGKTSLLNILSQRVKPTSGSLLANKTKAGKAFRSISAFVQQDDVLLPNLTVRETLRYAALLRLDSSLPNSSKMERVDVIMQELGLSKVADTIVGLPGLSKGISGGERKRLCIAIELLTEPSVLFLDEPTTGLDAKTSLNVIQLINRLAQHGRSVVLTIHQPRSDIFQLFDRLLLLARGKIAYFGDAHKAIPYFEKIGYTCPEEFNPADFVMDMVTENPSLASENSERGRRFKVEQDERIERILAHYTDSELKKENSQQGLEKSHALQDSLGVELVTLKKSSKYNSNWFYQFFVVLMRAFLNTIRNKGVNMARFSQQVSTAFLLGLIYLRLNNSQTGVQDRLGLLFFATSNLFFGSLSSSLNILLQDKPVLLRERGAKMYRVSSFYLARVVADIPGAVFYPILFGSVIYWWLGLNAAVERFFMFILIIVVMSLTGQALGCAIASFAPNPGVAFAIMPVVATILMLFGGFYKNLATIPVYFIWIYWTSIFHFVFESFVINEFKGLQLECGSSSFCPFPNGDAVLENLEMDTAMSVTWINLGLGLALILVYHVFAYTCLRVVVKPKGG